MPSCTNNSTISGILVNAEEATSGKRLVFKQNVAQQWESGITAGDVIRYDVDDKTFAKSVANPYYNGSLDLSLPEVIGIVEKIEQETDGITYATIVTHGLMKYPNLNSIIAGISATSGQYGGTDIFFLSPTIPGGITFEIEDGKRYIAKPILQVCPTSDTNGYYNSIVVNYLGYETAESEAYSLVTSETSVGELRTIPQDAQLPSGWIDASENQYLSISEYPSAYAIYGTKYGALEKLTINASGFISSLVGKSIRPLVSNKGLGEFAEIIETDVLNNTITIKHTSNSSFWKTGYGLYEISQTVSGINRLFVQNGTVTHFKTPIVQTNLTVNTENSIQQYKTIIRIRPDNRASYLPTNVTFNNIEITGTLGTQNIVDIDSKIIELQTRIQVLENKLGI